MTDLNDQLSDLFESTAGSADVPPLALHDVLARGHDLQRVRRRCAAIWTAVASAAAVVAVALPVALAQHGSSDEPAPVHHTRTAAPKGDPATLPYLRGHTLNIDGRTITTMATSILSRGGTTYVNDAATDPTTWFHVVGEQRTWVSGEVATKDEPWRGWHGQELSPDGGLLVVVTFPTQDFTRIVAYDTVDDTEIAHVDIDQPFSNWTGGGDDVTLRGIAGDDRVYWLEPPSGGRGSWTTWAWRPGHGDPAQLGEPFAGESYNALVVTPAGPLVGPSLLRQDKAGSWQGIATVEDGRSGAVWSPSGAVVARGGDDPDLFTPATGDIRAVDLPAPLLRWIGFENDVDVLAAVGTHDDAQLVRCTADGSCEHVQELPDGWRSWKWATNGQNTFPPSDMRSTDPDRGT